MIDRRPLISTAALAVIGAYLLRSGDLLAADPDTGVSHPVHVTPSLKPEMGTAQVSTAGSQSMFFHAKTTDGQWDTWLYWYRGMYYLFFLAGTPWGGIGMATSADGVHWVEKGMIIRQSSLSTAMCAGFTWKSTKFEEDKKFFLGFSETRGGSTDAHQLILFAESTDLISWHRLPEAYGFVPDERWYKKTPWCSISTMPSPDGGLYGYWTASPKPSVVGEFGFGESRDGVTWKALPPPVVENIVKGKITSADSGKTEDFGGEVGGVAKIGEHYFMMLGINVATIRKNGFDMGQGSGMLTYVADQPQGPFRLAKKNAMLLSGNTYFSRFFQSPSGLLVNHHSFISRENAAEKTNVFFAPLKRAVVDDEGVLRLKWWEGNNVLKSRLIDLYAAPADRSGLSWIGRAVRADSAVILEGKIELPKSTDSSPGGIYLEHGSEQGTAILIGANGLTQIGEMRGKDRKFELKDRIDRQLIMTGSVLVRFLLEQSLFEIYLDDHLIQCWSLPQPATGRIALIHPKAMTKLKLWEVR